MSIKARATTGSDQDQARGHGGIGINRRLGVCGMIGPTMNQNNQLSGEGGPDQGQDRTSGTEAGTHQKSTH